MGIDIGRKDIRSWAVVDGQSTTHGREARTATENNEGEEAALF